MNIALNVMSPEFLSNRHRKEGSGESVSTSKVKISANDRDLELQTISCVLVI